MSIKGRIGKSSNGCIKIRANEEEKRIIQNRAIAEGYKTMSAYGRVKIFENDLSTHKKLNELNDKIDFLLKLMKKDEKEWKTDRIGERVRFC